MLYSFFDAFAFWFSNSSLFPPVFPFSFFVDFFFNDSNALGYASISKIQRRCCCRPSGCKSLAVEAEGNYVFEEVRLQQIYSIHMRIHMSSYPLETGGGLFKDVRL